MKKRERSRIPSPPGSACSSGTTVWRIPSRAVASAQPHISSTHPNLSFASLSRLSVRQSSHHGRATWRSCVFEMITGDGPTGSTSSGLWYLAITGFSFGGSYLYVM